MTINNEQIKKILESSAGKIWENYGKRRIYIDIKTALNMDVGYYNTGNISFASIDGEKISNSRANKILSGKCFIDLNKNNEVVFQWATKEMTELIQNYLNTL